MKRLGNRVFLLPVIIVAIVLAGSTVLFNIVISQYVDDQVAASMNSYKNYYMATDNIQNEIDALKADKDKKNDAEIAKLENEINILTNEYVNTYNTITTQMVALDEQFVSQFATDREKDLVKYYEDHKEQVDSESLAEVDLEQSSYCISTTEMRLNDSDEKQQVLIYTDISSINALIKSVNRVLVIVISVAGILALIIGLIMAKSIQSSIFALREFLRNMEREGKRDKSRIKYRELKDLADYMEKLSDDRKASEKLQKMIFQNASHELRTPLMSIQGYAEGINMNVMKDHEAAAAIIISESKKMSELVDEMLFISRMDENPIKQEDMTTIELRQIIEDCREEICVVGEKKGVVIMESFDNAEYFVKGDEKQLTKAISNVMTNGIRYAKEKLTLSGTVENGIITLQIMDDGGGINEADLPHIFERFYKSKGGNFGIGLAITKEIIDRHGGTIKAENLGSGACFTIRLRAVEAERGATTEVISNGMLKGDVDMKEIINNIPKDDRQI